MKVFILIVLCSLFLHASPPQLFLLKSYNNDINVTGWVMSEKYDGVRAYWDGKQLISRSGKIFSADKNFTKDFPPFALDGELYYARGKFEHVVSIVNTHNSGKRWLELKYMIFEVPQQKGTLFERFEVLKTYLNEHKDTSIKIIKQTKIGNNEEVEIYFKKLINLGAEGIVIRNPHLQYYVGRKKDALKYKPYFDAECTIVKLFEGKGKYKGMLGALGCKFNEQLIKIGSGFSDVQRYNSFNIGTVITFKYYGLTRLGNPKYPVFLRVRMKKD